MNLCTLNLLFTSLALAAAEPPAITNLWLNDQTVAEIPVGLQRVTTVSFPGPIQALDAAGLTTDGRVPGLFQLAHQPGSSSFALRALATGASANLNVRLDQRLYVLLVSENRHPVLAVNFLAPTATSGSAAGAGAAAPTLTTSQLLGLLDKARAYEVLKQHHPRVVADVSVARPRSTNDYPACLVVLHEVFRFDDADALVFHVTLRNKTAQEVRYRPGSWAVRVGDRLYSQALADGDGIIPARGEAVAWFVIQGSPDGQRNQLSPRNPFIVLVNPL